MGRFFETRCTSNNAPLQCIQNTAACPVLDLHCRAHIVPALNKLHRLPIYLCITLKITNTMPSILHRDCPTYHSAIWYSLLALTPIDGVLNILQPQLVPLCGTNVVGDHAFSAAMLLVWCLWNSLPHEVTSAPMLAVCRKRLKSHLFSWSFPY